MIYHNLPRQWEILVLAEERQRRIEEYMQQVEFVTLDELARHLDVSVSTVRRDVSALEGGGNVRRTHGGARWVVPKSDEFTFSSRDTHELPEKEAIGRACAGLIKPRQTVIIDAGTTPYHVARHLESLTLQVVTNSLPVANLFASHARIEVVVSGGVIYPRLGVLVGPMAVDAFRKAHADVAIMSAGGITAAGVTNSHALLVEIQRAMMQAAGRVILCLDHTKLGRRSVAQLCGLGQIDLLITDSAAPEPTVAALRAEGLEVLIAPLGSRSADVTGNGQTDALGPAGEPAPTASEAEPQYEHSINVASWD
jgi:DeoR family transcriptional regulator, fructose operon transcriptional repressor